MMKIFSHGERKWEIGVWSGVWRHLERFRAIFRHFEPVGAS